MEEEEYEGLHEEDVDETTGKCPRFEDCSAPICPMDEQSIKSSNWYPDEDICVVRSFSSLPWVARQRKLQRKVRNRDFFFTHKMLCRNCKVTVATEGIDPDHDYDDLDRDVKKWLQTHPEIRELSEEEKDRLRERAARMRGTTPTEKKPLPWGIK